MQWIREDFLLSDDKALLDVDTIARRVTDTAVFSWLMDFIVAEEHRGKGIGRWIQECMCRPKPQ